MQFLLNWPWVLSFFFVSSVTTAIAVAGLYLVRKKFPADVLKENHEVAAIIGVGRLFIGAHYPSDIAAGIVVGLVAAGVVVRLLPRFVSWVVAYVERVTDPVLRSLGRHTTD